MIATAMDRRWEQPAEVEARQVGDDIEARQHVLRQREAEERSAAMVSKIAITPSEDASVV